jgi:hypothetical protein
VAFATDTFTDTAGTDLSAHTADDAGTWTKHTGTGSPGTGTVVVSDANRIRNGDGAASCYYHSGAPAGAEYDLQADWFVVTNPGALHESILGRIATAALDGYGVRFNTSGQWQLYKLVNGTLTSLGTFAQTLSTSTTYVVKLEIRDATKKVYIDGVERISSTDNAVTAAGKAGVRFFARTATNSTDRHLDNLTATDAGGGTTVTLTPAAETDTVQPLVFSKSLALTPAAETDTVQPLVFSKSLSLIPATEADAAQALSYFTGSSLTLTPATETDQAQPLSWSYTKTLIPATETDVAVALVIEGVEAAYGGFVRVRSGVDDGFIRQGDTAAGRFVRV